MILVIFPIAGNNGKYINIYDNEKKNLIFLVQIWNGLLPICIARKKNIVLQLSENWVQLYCNTVGWMG